MTIRFAERKDIESIVALCQLHAAFERAAFDATNKEEALKIYLFSSEPVLNCLVVETEGELVGYATFMKQFSTWDAHFYMYLDCLFLKEETRGQGIGLQIMNRIKEYAKFEKCICIQWQTPNFNEGAIAFYKTLGAKSKSKKRFFWSV